MKTSSALSRARWSGSLGAASLSLLAGLAVGQTGWSALGGGLGNTAFNRGEVYAITDFGGLPTYGGWFTRAGGQSASNVARWTGTAWQPIGGGVNAFSGPTLGSHGEVIALAVFQGQLYAGGAFTKYGTATVRRLAKWNGTNWVEVGGGLNLALNTTDASRVRALTVHDDGTGSALYVGGNFNNVPGSPNIVKWNGVTLSGVGGGLPHHVYALAEHASTTGVALFAGGAFNLGGSRVARWNGAGWSGVAGTSGGPNDIVYALAEFQDSTGAALYAGGKFTTVGITPANRIARWTGTAWQALPGPASPGLGSGATDAVYSLAQQTGASGCGNSLVVGGKFNHSAPSLTNIARWTGTQWIPLEAGASDIVYALSPDPGGSPGVFAGGNFVSAGGLSAPGAAAWSLTDCNGNCEDDAWDIASGFSTDCNRNGVPDECQPHLPVQTHLAPGNDCTGGATGAWQTRITLDRAWFQHDGDFLGGKGEGVLRWKTRPGHSADLTGSVPQQGRNVGQYTNIDINIGEIDVGKIKRSNKRHHHCDGKKTYNWKNIGATVYYDDGANDADLSPTDDANTRPWLEIEFHENDRRWVASSFFALLTPIMAAWELVSYPFTWVMNIPPVGALPWVLGNLDDAWNTPRGRLLGDLLITGASSLGVPGPLSAPRATENDTANYPLCPTTNRPTTLATFDLDNTRRDRFGNGHAHAEFNWSTLDGNDTGFEGQKIIDAPGDAQGAHTDAEEILTYEFFQKDGTLLTSRAVFARRYDALTGQSTGESHLIWPGAQTGDERVIHFYYDIDTNQATGAAAPPACGAEYDVRVRVRPNPSFNPVYRFAYATAEIWAWNPGTGWHLTAEKPVRMQHLFDRIEVTLDTADIGVCEINRRVASWTTVERRLSDGIQTTLIDAAPSSAALHCGPRPCIEIKGDTLCPRVQSVTARHNLGGEIDAFIVTFSEEVRPLTASDFTLMKKSSSVPFVINQTTGNPIVTLTAPGGGAFAAGQYGLTVKDSIRDPAGNQLDGDGLGGCGGDHTRTFCVSELHVSGKRETGEGPVDEFEEQEPIFLRAERLPAGANVRVYVVRDGALEQPGGVLIDQTSDGYDVFTVPAGGSLTGPYIGHLPFRGEYLIVIDVNANGVYEPAIDRACDECGIALRVGEECEQVPEGITAFFPFDESAAQPGAAEITGSFDALARGTPTPVAGAVGNGIALNPDDWFEVPSSGDTNPGEASFTIEFWWTAPLITSPYPIISKGPNPDAGGGAYEVNLNGADLGLILCTQVGGAGACMGYQTAGGPITPGVWHHIAVVVDRESTPDGSVSLYIDGALHTSFPSAMAGDLDSSAPLLIAPPWPDRPSVMMLDELCFWNVAVDAATIGAIFEQRSHCIAPAPDCPGDFNQDGGIDGSDVAAFFEVWEAGC